MVPPKTLLKDAAAEGEVIEELSRIITSTLDMGQVYEQFTVQVRRLIDFDRAGVNIIDEEKRVARIAYLSQRGGSYLGQGDNFSLEGSASGWVARTRRPLIRGDLAGDSRFWTAQEYYREALRSSLMAPLISKGRVLATLSLFSWSPTPTLSGNRGCWSGWPPIWHALLRTPFSSRRWTG